MTPRLFTPPGEQVTAAEAVQRRRANEAAQGALALDDSPAVAVCCPGCGSTAVGHVCTVEALALDLDA